jgi:hypothetical protein
MSRSWGELLGEAGAVPESEEQGGRFFSRLRDSLSKSPQALTGEIASAVAFRRHWPRSSRQRSVRSLLRTGSTGIRFATSRAIWAVTTPP